MASPALKTRIRFVVHHCMVSLHEQGQEMSAGRSYTLPCLLSPLHEYFCCSTPSDRTIVIAFSHAREQLFSHSDLICASYGLVCNCQSQTEENFILPSRWRISMDSNSRSRGLLSNRQTCLDKLLLEILEVITLTNVKAVKRK